LQLFLFKFLGKVALWQNWSVLAFGHQQVVGLPVCLLIALADFEAFTAHRLLVDDDPRRRFMVRETFKETE